ncbi:unnamed protein product [Effrenium voratum]|nr:unnamed protein product [Effrenium voratum]
MDFSRMSDVGIVQPKMPDFRDEPPYPITAQMSQTFQLLVNRLVAQHLLEVSQTEHNVEKRFTDEKVAASEPQVQLSPKGMSGNGKSVGFRDRSQSSDSASSHRESPTGREAAKKMSADAILNAFDNDQEVKKLFRDAEIQKMMQAGSEFDKEGSKAWWDKYAGLSCSEKLKVWLTSSRYEMCIALILILNVLWMAFELQFYGSLSGYQINFFTEAPASDEDIPSWEAVIEAGDFLFTCFFVLDVVVRIVVLRGHFWKVCANYVDVAVSMTALVEVTILYAVALPVNPILFRLLRIGKLARAIRMVTMTSVLGSLQLLVKCLGASCNMLFWSFCLLTFVQCVAGLIVSTLCRDFVLDPNYDIALRDEVFRYYGTFTRTLLTMFEILFANWGPPCRVLIENFSEWFSVFFLLYRCVLGFAVLNVVNAVFVQQTMKTAASDEELAFKQKEKDVQMYTRKVKRLFQTIDDSGDGAINLEEFSKLVQSPKLKFWMSQLELEYHDLLSLFEFLDNGDGEITLMEFIEGAARLRGNAKALDIWRIETKMEVLLEEVLKALQDVMPGNDGLTVEQVFENSSFRHIRATKQETRDLEKAYQFYQDGLAES